jgi:hypothetical protein
MRPNRAAMIPIGRRNPLHIARTPENVGFAHKKGKKNADFILPK